MANLSLSDAVMKQHDMRQFDRFGSSATDAIRAGFERCPASHPKATIHGTRPN
jgi:hypothetical protein